VKEQRNPSTIHAPLAGYSHQIEISGDERMLVLSGQVGMTPDGGIPEDPAAQLEVALANVLRNLAAAGMQAGDLVKITYYFVEPIDADARRTIISQQLGDHQSCATLVYVAALAAPALKVEVDAWASASS
jgi:enamine deaminase RidA (YjgF/YER057c/UK114 family)